VKFKYHLSSYPLIVTMLLPLTTNSAGAGVIVVDGHRCTLGHAITAADANTRSGGCSAGDDRDQGGDTILLATDVTLTTPDNNDVNGCPNGLPVITSKIIIEGKGHTVARSDADNTPYFRLLYVGTGGDLTLNQITLTNGRLPDFQSELVCGGGAVDSSHGPLTLNETNISGNDTFFGGGGIFGSDITLNMSSVTGNTTGADGGGILGGTVTLWKSNVSENRGIFGDGDGICARNVTLKYSTVSGNGQYSYETTLLSAEAITPPPSHCYGGGGISGDLVLLDHSTVTGNYAGTTAPGGGIYGQMVTLNSSTVSDNFASDSLAGGIYGGIVTLTNSTISGNRSALSTSGIEAGTIVSTHSTIAGNSTALYGGKGIQAGSAILINTIIANNEKTGQGIEGDCVSNQVAFAGVNLIMDGTCNAVANGQLTGDPLLGALSDNGGSTLTLPLLPGSPAIDQIAFIPDVGCSATLVTTDQRDIDRPQGSGCDIGAYEAE
jgi:fibronectin-binding autotransporter adhesin